VTRLRLAEDEDIPTIVEMGAEMFAGSSFAPLVYTPDKVADFVRRLLGTGLVALSVDDDAVTGMILGEVTEPWYCAHRMGVEHVLYVRPKYQGSRAALMLVRAWQEWCKGCGAVQLRPATAATSEAADRLYTALGFERVGSLYVMNRN
jgi:L-amino acid N-acyltransferase YncA